MREDCEMEVVIGGRSKSRVDEGQAPRRGNRAAIRAVMSPQKSRMRALTFPREHGAWGILLVPLMVGASVGAALGGHLLPLLPFTIATLALFCLRTPVESLLGTTPMKAQTSEERRKVLSVIVF